MVLKLIQNFAHSNKTTIAAMPFWRLKRKEVNPPQIHFSILTAYLTIPFTQNLDIMKIWDPILFFVIEI